MQNKRNLSERLFKFGAGSIKLSAKIDKTYAGKHISNQFMRSETSSGANYEEACGTESKADFIHKMQIVLKELRESFYWLKLIRKSGLSHDNEIQNFTLEAEELIKIVAKSVITAKRNRK